MNGPVRIAIDVMSVSGFDAAQAAAFGRAFERALAQLVERHGWPGAGPGGDLRDSLRVDGVSIRGGQPERAGEAVARAVYRRLDR